MYKVAVTGGLSSGKSTVCQIFKELGAYTVSADAIVHQLLSPNHPIGQKVIDLLGQGIVVNEKLDRAQIAQKVFDQPLLLKSLEQILHPAVMKEIDKQYKKVLKSNDAPLLFVAEIPLLFEGNFEGLFDSTIAVISDREIAVERFKQLTKKELAEYCRRSKHQLPPEEKASRATHILHNNGTIEELKSQIKNLYYNLTHNNHL